MRQSRRIVVVGSSGTDMIIRVERIPRPGETLIGGEFAMAAGGKGANQAVSAARAGGDVTFVARVGRDNFGEQSIAGFVSDGIDVQHVLRDGKAPSGIALIFVAKDGENSIAVSSGANARLTPADVRRARSVFNGAAVLIVQLESPLATVQAAVSIAVRHGLQVILNPAPARALPDSLLRQVSILTPNETEAELLTGVKVNSDAAAAKASAILRRCGVQTVILTLGARGAFVATEGGTQLVSGFKVKAVDTTAAGDVFNGALAVALAEQRPLQQAVRFANAAAAIAVTRLGAQPSAPSRRQIERMLKSG
jgi:ribokinase